MILRHAFTATALHIYIRITLLLSILDEVTGDVVSEGKTMWQLHNHCSHGFVQTFMRHINANGSMDSRCLTDFIVHVYPGAEIQIQHAMSRKFLCFNKRRRITVRADGTNRRCFFVERLSEAGYTELESAWEPGLYLGFNKRGRFQDPMTYFSRRKCFSFTKFERYVPNSELRNCMKSSRTTTQPPPQIDTNKLMARLLKESLLERIRARPDDQYQYYRFN